MANSQSLRGSIAKAQDVVVCNLCESNYKIKCKCLDCGLMMCKRCHEKVHSKFASAKDHTIIDIKDIGKHQAEPDEEIDFTKIKCVAHNSKYCCLYCKSCEQLVCQSCVAETHNKHHFCEIGDEYQNKVNQIKNEQENMNKRLQTLTINHGKLRQVKFLENKSFYKAREEIAAHEKGLVDAIHDYTNKLLAELDKGYTDILLRVDEAEGKVKETENKFRDQNEKVDEFLQSNDVEKVFSSADSLLKSMKICIPPINTAFDHIPKFVPYDTSDISKLYGKLKDVNLPYNIDFRVKQQYSTKLKIIYNIIECQDGSLWINDQSSQVQKVNSEADALKVISQLEVFAKDMALYPPDDLILSIQDSSALKLVPNGSNDIEDSLFSVSPLLTVGVHTTATNEIIIGARATESISIEPGQGQVIVMAQTGQQERVFQYDSHNNPLFSCPLRITSNSNNNIAVIDMESFDYKGRVVVLNLNDGVRNIYSGHPSVNNDNNPFTPGGIVTTPSDNFVVADTINHTLHILNSEGEIITYHNIKRKNIKLPFSLTYSSTGQLYIGCDTYNDSNDSAKIFVVENFVW